MRKWSKLLALVLAMVMAFGLTAAAFAAEEDGKEEDPAVADTAEPAEGDDATEPAEGDDAAEPAEDEDTAEPAEDDDAADPYADVSSWAKEAVAAIVEKNLMDMGETGFDPKANVTRADLVAALYRLAGSPANAADAENPFDDVDDDAAYKDAVIWANSKNIVNGKGEGVFDPTGDIKRQEIAKVLFEYAKAEAVEEDNLAIFADTDTIAAWAKDYVNWAVANNLITGKAEGSITRMDPTGTTTRQEAAVLLNRYITEILPAEAEDPAGAEGAVEDEKPENDVPETPDETTDPEDGETSEPAEGEENAEPAEGEENTEPAEGEENTEPAEGEGDTEPAEGEGDAEPAEGEAE